MGNLLHGPKLPALDLKFVNKLPGSPPNLKEPVSTLIRVSTPSQASMMMRRPVTVLVRIFLPMVRRSSDGPEIRSMMPPTATNSMVAGKATFFMRKFVMFIVRMPRWQMVQPEPPARHASGTRAAAAAKGDAYINNANSAMTLSGRLRKRVLIPVG